MTKNYLDEINKWTLLQTGCIIRQAIVGVLLDAIERKDENTIQVIHDILQQLLYDQQLKQYLKKHPEEIIIP